ncbi:MAG: response regulator [Ignavibacteriales bacterium]|nr:response regulator [Ignavibacteriales bacterium]
MQSARKTPTPSLSSPPNSTAQVAQEERRTRVSALLKQADQAVKSNDLNAALASVRKVYEHDPKNMYARAYEDRIVALITESEAKKGVPASQRDLPQPDPAMMHEKVNEIHSLQEMEAQKRKQKEQDAEELEQRARQASVNERKELLAKDLQSLEAEALKRVETMEQRMSEQVKRLLEEEKHRLEEQSRGALEELKASVERAQAVSKSKLEEQSTMDKLKAETEAELDRMKQQFKLQMIAKTEAERRQIQAEIFKKLKEEQTKKEVELAVRVEDEHQTILQRAEQKTREVALETYRTQMMVMMQYKLPPDVLEDLSKGLRISLSITDKEHIQIQQSVRSKAFIDAVKEAWKHGRLSHDESEVLENLGNLYQVPPAQQKAIHAQVRQELGVTTQPAVILALDDEEFILEFIEMILKQKYGSVLTAKTVNQALKLMKQTKPSLVISDVNLGTPDITGFTFCERMTQGEYGEEFKGIPFIVMSAISDDFFIKSAKQIGAKAYMPKPFTREKLERTIQLALS